MGVFVGETNLRKAILQTGQRSSGLHQLFALVQFYEVLGTVWTLGALLCVYFFGTKWVETYNFLFFYAEKEGKHSFNVFPECLLSTCSCSACALVVHKKGC